MIVLWAISLGILVTYTFIVFKTDFEGKEGIGLVKWLVIVSLLMVIFTFAWMGAKIWLKN